MARMKRYKKPSQLKAATIGYGPSFNMGKKHLAEMRKAGMVPTAVCDLNPDVLKVAEQDYPGIKTYTSVAKMLKESGANIVTIITPHNTHVKLGMQCLKAGCHVIMEKPFAITTAECDRLIRTAKERGLLISVYHNRHWDGCIREAVKHVVDKKEIGEVIKIRMSMGAYRKPKAWWRCSKSISGGILFDWGAHLLEYAFQIIDGKIQEVTGYSRSGSWAKQSPWKNDTIEDDAHFSVRLDKDRWLTLSMSNIDSHPVDRWFEVVGTKGTYYMNMRDYSMVVQKPAGPKIREGQNCSSQSAKFYRNIADYLVKREKLIITPEWARRPVHVIDLACKSAKVGRALKATYQ